MIFPFVLFSFRSSLVSGRSIGMTCSSCGANGFLIVAIPLSSFDPPHNAIAHALELLDSPVHEVFHQRHPSRSIAESAVNRFLLAARTHDARDAGAPAVPTTHVHFHFSQHFLQCTYLSRSFGC